MTLAVFAVVISVTMVILSSIWVLGMTTVSAPFQDWALSNLTLAAWTATGVTAFVGIASLYRIATLNQGGGKVARDMGGTSISTDDRDPLRRRLRNVVEEMAIASGIPTPEIYVLDHEEGINAFAAGFNTEDAAVAVTRGALETLSRDELQGVIAHEFSHIFNGDMRLNIKLMGPMFGILAIGFLGRLLIRSPTYTRGGRRGGGSGVILILGAGLTITGFVGLFLARLIKAGVSRQREYLADASAVQFTRQKTGLAGALKKIAGLTERSVLHADDTEEISHMLFASGFNGLSSLLATHPPILERIQALDPGFTEDKLANLHTERVQPAQGTASELTSGMAGEGSMTSNQISSTPEKVFSSIGHPGESHFLYAQKLVANLPEDIREALDSSYQAMLLIIALMLSDNDAIRSQQLNLVSQQVGSERAETTKSLHTTYLKIFGEHRLQLLQLALPRIKEQPSGRQQYLADLLEQLAILDNQIELYEYALLKLYRQYIERAANPNARQHRKSFSSRPVRQAAEHLLTLFGAFSNRNPEQVRQVLANGDHGLTITSAGFTDTPKENWLSEMDKALDRLQGCTPHDRSLLVSALTDVALADQQLTESEGELLRAVCAILDCPLPPIAANH